MTSKVFVSLTAYVNIYYYYHYHYHYHYHYCYCYYYYYYYYYYFQLTPAGNTQRYYIAGEVRRRGKTGNHEKVGVKRKWWVLSQPPYSYQGNGRQSPRVKPWNQGIDPLTQGAGVVKWWED